MVSLLIKQVGLAKKIDPGAAVRQWNDWKWQMRHAVRDIPSFEELTGVHFNREERRELEKTIEHFPLNITPYYLSLIDTADMKNDPVYKQCFPSPEELNVEKCDMVDPLAEEEDSPVPGITHRYPDRVLFLVSNVCAMYCRHCTRKRKVGNVDYIPDRETILKGIDYIRDNPSIRDVLLSGGDPLMLPDDYLDWILSELDNIPHVEVVRIGTRVPVVLPCRITDDLVEMLKGHHPLWINTHFNHPKEVTPASREALRKLADAGIPLGNQCVLLAGVNDCPQIMKKLFQKLVQNRVRPYYMFQCDLSEGLSHFRTSVSKGIEIIENLVGHTSGFAVPTYVVDAPGGGGKIPVMPNYLISSATNKVVMRNYEGVITTYTEPDAYKAAKCDGNCQACHLQHDDVSSENEVGIARLLSDRDETISIIPSNNRRIGRRYDA
ncbi:L-lysine 2,3-aminomutase [Methanocella paludicola SANAE]|uniref:L-lysine 2,3-aminomutase n=1 Tax=Methanocella paludicola (strain DSM 17711 / JCM 13418 / NBRC 101707 / SANAE) TaxID=304371 RepID=D1YZW9_METPS|nr:lysine 2,3-aminomutase [Methanocella paludicola]BAI61991.1 L-lysine 2,3-aminomutase [Methanocella paludicola SANAE]